MTAARDMRSTIVPYLFKHVVILLFAALVMSSCARQSEWATRVVWEELDPKRLPGHTDYPDAEAVVLRDEGKMEIFGSEDLGFSAFEQHKIVKILSVRGHRFANVVIPYGSGSEVSGIRARTVSPDGKITVLDEKNIFDVSLYPNFVFFSDQRAKIFTLPAVDNGSAVEYEYRVNIRNRSVWHSWSFQSEAPTMLSRFTLVKPSEWDVSYRTYTIPVQPIITNAPAGFKSTYVWEARNVPALRPEFAMPARSECIARLVMAPVGFKTWADVSQWYLGLAAPRTKAGPGIRALAQQLTAGIDDKKEKLRLVYEWVRDNVRYVAVEIGIGGFQPHAADEVRVNQYGDCKDMTTLLCSLGKEAGLDVRQVLVSTWQNGKPDTSLPSPLHFNHVIAYSPSVGENGIWMDATEKGCPFGELPWYDQGLPVLVIGEKGEERLLATPRIPSEQNRELLDWRVDLEASGSATVQGRSLFWGAAASELREEICFASPNERRQWLETLLAKRCSGAQLDSFHVAGVSPTSDPLAISYAFRTATFARRRSSAVVLRPGQIVASDLPDYFRSLSRSYPVRFRYGLQTELNLEVNLPHAWKADTAAVRDSVTSSFGSLQWNWRDEGGVFRARSTFLLRGDDVPPIEYPRFRRFLDDVREKDLREAVLIPHEE